jgi:SH3-like domain-containing protein
LVAAWVVTLGFIAFLGVTATAVGLKWPAAWARTLGMEVEEAICSSPIAAQDAHSCDAGGDWVVVGILLNDSDGVALIMRDSPNGAPLHRMMPNSTGIAADQCDGNWCHVQCDGISGWSRQKYLKPRSDQLRTLVGVSPVDGLGIRSGPNPTCHARSSVQYNKSVILHGCESVDQSEWCRITYEKASGWIPRAYVDFSK